MWRVSLKQARARYLADRLFYPQDEQEPGRTPEHTISSSSATKLPALLCFKLRLLGAWSRLGKMRPKVTKEPPPRAAGCMSDSIEGADAATTHSGMEHNLHGTSSRRWQAEGKKIQKGKIIRYLEYRTGELGAQMGVPETLNAQHASSQPANILQGKGPKEPGRRNSKKQTKKGERGKKKKKKNPIARTSKA